jgi:REP element-mobilizing transposase RayT
MPPKFKIKDKDKTYFLTLSTIGWVDLFTNREQKLVIIEALKEYRENKGLDIFAYCLMTNHLHIICRAREGHDLPAVIKDFKKATTKLIIKVVKLKSEKRKEWLLQIFKKSFDHLMTKKRYKVWQGNNQAVLLYSNELYKEKMNILHNDPVEDMTVENPTDYIFSSARNYADLESVLEVTVLRKLP